MLGVGKNSLVCSRKKRTLRDLNVIPLFALAQCVVSMLACNKLPVGEDEFTNRGDFSPQTVELSLYRAFSEHKYLQLGTSQNLIIGKNDIYESRILLKFKFSDTTYSGADEIKLILYRNENLDLDTLALSVHLLENSFTETEATWYKRSNTEIWTSPGGDYDLDSLRCAQVNGDSLLIRFNYIDLDAIRRSKGLILVPLDQGFCGFYSKEGNNSPAFRIVKNGVVTAISLEADCHIIKADSIYNYWESWLGTGIGYRNFVKFSYDTTLDGKRAVYGELTVRPEKFITLRDSVEIGIRELLEPFIGYDTRVGALIDLEKFSTEDTLFTFDIVQHIQRLVEHPDSNFGFIIYMSPENYDIGNIKLVHGSHRLKVGFIPPPVER